MMYETIQDAVVTRLRRDILRGTLEPGQRIIERVVATEMGISKTPVREALTHLEAQGLVRIHPHRGAFVTAISVQELRQIYLVRAHLEGLAALLAASRVDPATIASLRHIVSSMEATGPGEIESFMTLNNEFHNVFYNMSGENILCETIDSLRVRSLRYRWLFMDLSESKSRMIMRRWQLIDLLEGGNDPEAVRNFVERNLKENCIVLEQKMKEA